MLSLCHFGKFCDLAKVWLFARSVLYIENIHLIIFYNFVISASLGFKILFFNIYLGVIWFSFFFSFSVFVWLSLGKKKKKKMAYPCGDCGGNCITDVSCCDNCENWFHYKCQNLLKKNVTEIRSRKNSFCDYVCTKCTKTVDGNFDFEKSLKRLENIHFLDIWKQVRE